MKERDNVSDLVDAGLALLAITIDPAWKPEICTQLSRTLEVAKLFDSFPLPDETEQAPVFEA